MSYELRPYQKESIEAIKNLQPNYNGIIALPTGSGKTVIMSAIANKTKSRCLIVVQSSELREQTIDKLLKTNSSLDVGSVQASLDQVSNKIVVSTRQSLTHAKSTRLERMSEYGDFELVFFDECHNAVGQIKKIVDKLNSNIKVIGLTATPYNEDMSKVFDGIIYSKSILEMIKNNYLCEPIAKYVYSQTDLSNVKTIAGEFNQRQLEDTVNNDNRNDIIVNAYLEYAKDRKATIVFASGIEHARDISKTFNDNGIVCDYVDSTIEDNKRDQIISDFKQGKLPVIVNVGILTTGFDHEPTDCIIFARPTKSKILYTQILGRGLRTAEDKENCLVIDVVDIVRKHDLMTMTDIFGVDIKDGETLSEAIEREEKDKAEKLERELIAKQKEEERLRLIAEELKLFKTNMGDYFSESYYDWFKCDNDIYSLSTNSDLHYTIYKNLSENTFELYFINTTNKINTKNYLSEEDNLVNLIEEAEKYASRKYSTFLDRKAKWKHESATQKQLDWLKKEWWASGKIINTKMDVHKVTKANKIVWIMKKKK
jgi:superfamily II DNA or RNA helicase